MASLVSDEIKAWCAHNEAYLIPSADICPTYIAPVVNLFSRTASAIPASQTAVATIQASSTDTNAFIFYFSSTGDFDSVVNIVTSDTSKCTYLIMRLTSSSSVDHLAKQWRALPTTHRSHTRYFCDAESKAPGQSIILYSSFWIGARFLLHPPAPHPPSHVITDGAVRQYLHHFQNFFLPPASSYDSVITPTPFLAIDVDVAVSPATGQTPFQLVASHLSDAKALIIIPVTDTKQFVEFTTAVSSAEVKAQWIIIWPGNSIISRRSTQPLPPKATGAPERFPTTDLTTPMHHIFVLSSYRRTRINSWSSGEWRRGDLLPSSWPCVCACLNEDNAAICKNPVCKKPKLVGDALAAQLEAHTKKLATVDWGEEFDDAHNQLEPCLSLSLSPSLPLSLSPSPPSLPLSLSLSLSLSIFLLLASGVVLPHCSVVKWVVPVSDDDVQRFCRLNEPNMLPHRRLFPTFIAPMGNPFTRDDAVGAGDAGAGVALATRYRTDRDALVFIFCTRSEDMRLFTAVFDSKECVCSWLILRPTTKSIILQHHRQYTDPLMVHSQRHRYGGLHYRGYNHGVYWCGSYYIRLATAPDASLNKFVDDDVRQWVQHHQPCLLPPPDSYDVIVTPLTSTKRHFRPLFALSHAIFPILLETPLQLMLRYLHNKRALIVMAINNKEDYLQLMPLLLAGDRTAQFVMVWYGSSFLIQSGELDFLTSAPASYNEPEAIELGIASMHHILAQSSHEMAGQFVNFIGKDEWRNAGLSPTQWLCIDAGCSTINEDEDTKCSKCGEAKGDADELAEAKRCHTRSLALKVSEAHQRAARVRVEADMKAHRRCNYDGCTKPVVEHGDHAQCLCGRDAWCSFLCAQLHSRLVVALSISLPHLHRPLLVFHFFFWCCSVRHHSNAAVVNARSLSARLRRRGVMRNPNMFGARSVVA
jgi:hypothetical protein